MQPGDRVARTSPAIAGCRWRAKIRETIVLDIIFLVVGLGFFAASCLYLYACDRL